MSYRIAKAAQKALSLDYDGVCRLLLLMSFLLCWIVALGAAGVAGLNGVYQQWRLNQQSQVSVYVLPETEQAELTQFVSKVQAFPEVVGVTPLAEAEVRSLLQPYFQADQAFPLPGVLEVNVTPAFDREAFDAVVADVMPTAEVDDNREMLQAVAKVVRLAQGAILALAAALMLVTGFLVVLTVRVGLKSQRRALSILQFLGGTDRFLADLVVRQVVARSLGGWLLACGAAALCLGALALWWPTLLDLKNPAIWLALAGVPLLLPLMAWVAALVTARAVVQRGA